MFTISWVIKASKLCNLRCRYCYEWNDLDKADRISLADWEKLLTAIRSYHQIQINRLDSPVTSLIIWHGGEPLILPSHYFEAVLELQRSILGAEALRRGEYRNGLQTNLYALSEDKLDMLEREGFEVGISMDVAAGVRLNLSGLETEPRVAKNMDRLRARGIPFGAIVVLAGHSMEVLRKIYDFYETLEVPFSILPLLPAPLNSPNASFYITREQILDAMKGLFVYWMEKGCGIKVDPLQDYLQNVLAHITSLSRPRLNRRASGHSVFVVNTDGYLYEGDDCYEQEKSMGNVFGQSIEEIISSEAYDRSLDRHEYLFRLHCQSCKYLGGCDTVPLHHLPRNEDPQGRCRIAYSMHTFIESYLRENGFTEEELERMLFEEERPFSVSKEHLLSASENLIH